MKETNFQRILVTSFKQAGALVFNIHGHSMQIAGIPDLYVAHKVWTGWLELKTGVNKATKLQISTLRKLEVMGVNVLILVERKPKIIVKDSYETMIAQFPFMTNNLDGEELLDGLAFVSEL